MLWFTPKGIGFRKSKNEPSEDGQKQLWILAMRRRLRLPTSGFQRIELVMEPLENWQGGGKVPGQGIGDNPSPTRASRKEIQLRGLRLVLCSAFRGINHCPSSQSLISHRNTPTSVFLVHTVETRQRSDHISPVQRQANHSLNSSIIDGRIILTALNRTNPDCISAFGNLKGPASDRCRLILYRAIHMK